jgi:hypothetical protein
VNALASPQVADYLQDRFVATSMKVGTFQIVGDQKVGGNVASYFCLPDGSVLHAGPGPVDARTFLSEARWAWDIRKTASMLSTDLVTGALDAARLQDEVSRAHRERFVAALPSAGGRKVRMDPRIANRDASKTTLPQALPEHVNQQAQVNWLLASRSLARIDEVYPIVWEEILRERLSGLPVVMR